MNAMLTNIHFYDTDPTASKSVTKSTINHTRKELLQIEMGTAEKASVFRKDSCPSVTIRIDTPVLRSQRPRQVISMTSKAGTMPCKFFPTIATSKPPLPPAKPEPKPVIDSNLNRSLRRMSIAKKKLDRGVALARASLFKPSDTQPAPPQTLAFPESAKPKLSPEKEPDPKSKKRIKMRKAVQFLKEYALSLKSLLKTTLGVTTHNHSPIVDRTRPPVPPLVKHDSYGKIRIPSSNQSAGSNNSTVVNSPELEEKKKPEPKPQPAQQLATISQPEYLAVPRREKKRRYTTPDEYPPKNDLGFPKTTFAAIERLAFEPVIK